SQVIRNAVAEIKSVAGKVGAGRVVIYPYAHLSSSLADKDVALTILSGIEEGLSGEKMEVHRSPFGWYKSFKLECKGHPLSELSRTIKAEDVEEERAALKTVYMVLDLEGNLHDPEAYQPKAGEAEFAALVEKEALKRGLEGGRPRFLEVCRKFGVEWEPYSDIGHMRYGPEATLMFDLISDFAWAVVKSLGVPVFQIRGTNMFNLSERPVKEHAKLFGDKLYEVDVDDRSLVLRYAACHQQFSSVKDWSISYRHLPFGTFEVADSYRLEQSGELLLCFRVRKLHMPDLHIYCKDQNEAIEVSLALHKKIYEEIRRLGREYVSIYNTTESFFRGNKEFFMKLLEVEQKPVLLNFVPEGVYYWVINVEYTIIDDLDRPREIATFQIDMGNAERFNISYVDEKGERRYPPIIHTAIIGTVERYLFTLFDSAVKMEKRGEKPMLPLWLAPTQVRVIPVSKEYLSHALRVCDKLTYSSVRSDVDDRETTLSKRVREAEVNWIPYTIVIGEREAGRDLLPVRVRGEKGTREMTLDELVEEVHRRTEGYPFRHIQFPSRLSLKPIYK
ncbi:MAG: threonine--tRNA ligase, partial [Candidatus Bathyarchaeia archaeon]